MVGLTGRVIAVFGVYLERRQNGKLDSTVANGATCPDYASNEKTHRAPSFCLPKWPSKSNARTVEVVWHWSKRETCTARARAACRRLMVPARSVSQVSQPCTLFGIDHPRSIEPSPCLRMMRKNIRNTVENWVFGCPGSKLAQGLLWGIA
jgi:hypothetical protein